MQPAYRILLPALLFGVALTFAPASPADDKPSEGWVPLFNGKDLTGWMTHENPNPGAYSEGGRQEERRRQGDRYVG